MEPTPAPRRVRRWINKLAALLSLTDPAREADDFFRADGRVECHTCATPYFEHAQDPRDPWLHILCDGARVKL